ncbi:MAG: RDD family protein [Arenimonas sp.]
MNTNTTAAQRDSAYPVHLGWRILAITYDVLPMIPLLFISSIVLLLLHGGKPAQPGTAWAFFSIFIYWAVVGCYAVISWRRGGQTMGMRPWRLLVVNEEGKNASLKSLCLRYAIASLSCGLVLLWCLFDPKKRGVHDIASGTLVVRKNANAVAGKVQNSVPSK